MPAIFNAQGEQLSLATFSSIIEIGTALIVNTPLDLPTLDEPGIAIVITPFAVHLTNGIEGWISVSQQVIFPETELPSPVAPNTLAIFQSDLTIHFTTDGVNWILIPTGSEGDLTQLSQAVSQLFSDMLEIKSDISLNETNLDLLQEEVNTLEEQVEINGENIEALQVQQVINTQAISDIEITLENLGIVLQAIATSQNLTLIDPSGGGV